MPRNPAKTQYRNHNAYGGIRPAREWKPVRREDKLPNLRDFNTHNPKCPLHLNSNFSLELPHLGISVLFQQIEARLCWEINSTAEGEFIFVAIAWLTSTPILTALASARDRKVIVLVVVQKETWIRQGKSLTKFDRRVRNHYEDLGGYNTHKDLEELLGSFVNPGEKWSFNDNKLGQARKGCDVAAVRCLGVHAKWTGRMHHKFMVFGRKQVFFTATKVLTGSYNFSSAAEAGLENVIIINHPEVAARYAKEFVTILLHSEPLDWVSEQMQPTFTCEPQTFM